MFGTEFAARCAAMHERLKNFARATTTAVIDWDSISTAVVK